MHPINCSTTIVEIQRRRLPPKLVGEFEFSAGGRKHRRSSSNAINGGFLSTDLVEIRYGRFSIISFCFPKISKVVLQV
jgi:hypothetical protein